MARHDLEALILTLRYTKGDDGRIVPCHIVAMALGQCPRAALIEAGETGVLDWLLHKMHSGYDPENGAVPYSLPDDSFSILTICVKHDDYSRVEYVLFVKIIL